VGPPEKAKINPSKKVAKSRRNPPKPHSFGGSMVETTGLELPTFILSHVKGCGIQMNTRESETFHVTSCPIFIHGFPL
jgi:hypothetical protein